jgi:hypothetical protein
MQSSSPHLNTARRVGHFYNPPEHFILKVETVELPTLVVMNPETLIEDLRD